MFALTLSNFDKLLNTRLFRMKLWKFLNACYFYLSILNVQEAFRARRLHHRKFFTIMIFFCFHLLVKAYCV